MAAKANHDPIIITKEATVTEGGGLPGWGLLSEIIIAKPMQKLHSQTRATSGFKNRGIAACHIAMAMAVGICPASTVDHERNCA